MNRPLPAALLATAAAALGPAPAEACAPCGVGDPTITVMGAEPPLAGRLRFSLELDGRWDQVQADDAADVLIIEGRTTLAASYAPADWVTLSVSAPLVLRDMRSQRLEHYQTLGLGDAELRGRFVLLRDRRFAPRNLLGPTLGVRAPTAIDHVGANGQLLPVDAQSGAGTVDALLGVFYGHFEAPWSFFASAGVDLPFARRYSDAPGPSARLTAALQYQVDRWITLRGAIDARVDAAVVLEDRIAPHTEHFSLFFSPDLLWSPVSDWTLRLGVRAPLFQISERGRAEGWYVRVGVTVDVI